MSDAMPPLPPNMRSWIADRVNGPSTLAVRVQDAALLMGVRAGLIEHWVSRKRVESFKDVDERTGQTHRFVCCDSLWDVVPKRLRQGT